VTPRGYHHGDLPAALKRAVFELVVEGGLPAVTMTAAAKRAGVSPGAPYKHFAGLEDLLVAAAEDGYRRFRARQQVVAASHDDPTDKLLAIIADYFAFARDEPGSFALMWGTGLTRQSRRLDEWALGDYARVVGLLVEITGRNAEDCHELAMNIASLVIGNARIAIDRYSPVSTPEQAPGFADRGVRQLIAGFLVDSSRMG
jgi:AcrR family transcriptional regulator